MSATTDFSQIMLDLKRRIFKPVYFLTGEEPYYIDAISDYIEEHALGEAERGFNQTVVYGKDTELSAILGLARQFPMMGEKNVVIVKEAQNIRELARGKSDDDEEPSASPSGALQHLVHYINEPQETTILVFCYKYKTLDKRSAVAKAAQKKGVFLETKKLYDNQVPDWINGYVKEQGYKIHPKASALLAEYVGTDLSRLTGELGKLFIKIPQGGEITPDVIQENTGISKEYNVFELQDALGTRDVLKANRIINYFAANEKDNPMPVVLSMLHMYFMKVLCYHFAPDKSKFAVAQTIGVNPYFAEKYARAAAIYPTPRLKQVFSVLKEFDLRSKGVNNATVPAGELLKEMVFRILH